jgi:hypothetical protein
MSDERKPPKKETDISVESRLETVEKPDLAADLFARILRAVRGEKADQERKRNDAA